MSNPIAEPTEDLPRRGGFVRHVWRLGIIVLAIGGGNFRIQNAQTPGPSS